MKALTPMQIDTLTSFYYGEVRLMWVPVARPYVPALRFFNADGIDISGRIKSLRRRKLIRYQLPKNLGEGVGGMVVWITEAGVKEMEAIDA